jgi:hypothetical protein
MFRSVVLTIRSNLPSILQFAKHAANFEVGNFEVGNFKVKNSNSRYQK